MATVLAGLLAFSAAAPASSLIAQPERTILTLELLQERLKSPATRDGIRTLDLRQMVIDLRSQNAEFREQFYQLLPAHLNRLGAAVGLDLSYSLILGDFDGAALGLRSPLYGQALSPLFSPAEQEVLQRDRRRLSQLSQLSRLLLGTLPPAIGQIAVFRAPLNLMQTRFSGSVNFTNTFFLDRVEAQGAEFAQDADFSETRFSKGANFAAANFNRDARFRSSIFFAKAGFNQVLFQGIANFTSATFEESANFNQVVFKQPANFARSQYRQNADFSQSQYQDVGIFAKARFSQSLFLTDATFAKTANFREARFSQPVNLRGAVVLDRAVFSDAGFEGGTYLNVTDLEFDADSAKIIGDPGQIGKILSVRTLYGNENLLRNLVRNFRLLEQISDANQIEYMAAKLEHEQLRRHLAGANVNTASVARLMQIGFSREQGEAIARFRAGEPFRNLSDLLALEEIDLASYVKVRDRAVAGEALSLLGWLSSAFSWLMLSVLLLLSRYGTSSWLVLGVGIVAIAYFSLLFWFVDRWRRILPKPILPTAAESISMLLSFVLLGGSGLIAIFRTSEQPWLTLICLGIFIVPVPALLILRLYQGGRYHNLMEVSYFVEDASMRQLRLTIGRLPVMPRYPMFRDRHLPILWDKRWNWLNYYDFSLNNLLKFGFNDIRARDEHLPGLISALVWYQWALGLFYITLLLWTLSRTIPGLNLLIYLK